MFKKETFRPLYKSCHKEINNLKIEWDTNQGLSDEILVALVSRVNGHGDVTKKRFRPCCRNDDFVDR
jgi:hypothetical protein